MPFACPNGQQTTVANGQSRSEGAPSRSSGGKSLAWSQARRLLIDWWSGAGSNRRPSAFQAEDVEASAPATSLSAHAL